MDSNIPLKESNSSIHIPAPLHLSTKATNAEQAPTPTSAASAYIYINQADWFDPLSASSSQSFSRVSPDWVDPLEEWDNNPSESTEFCIDPLLNTHPRSNSSSPTESLTRHKRKRTDSCSSVDTWYLNSLENSDEMMSGEVGARLVSFETLSTDLLDLPLGYSKSSLR